MAADSPQWLGDVGASSATFGYSFRGARIIAATISSLVSTQGLGTLPGARLLFGGGSAGAIGALCALDSVAASVPAGVRVQGLIDAAAMVDVYSSGWPWSSELVPLQTEVAKGVAVWGPVAPPACVQRGFIGSSAWKCWWSSYRMSFVQTPYFTNIVSLDDFELQYDTDNYFPATQAQFDFVNSLQASFLDLIAQLPPGTGVYSPSCLVHCLSGEPSYYTFTVNGETMSSALNAWFFDELPTSVVSPCVGWACVEACGVTATSLPCNIGAAGCSPVSLPTDQSASSDTGSSPGGEVTAEVTSLNTTQRAALAQATAQANSQVSSETSGDAGGGGGGAGAPSTVAALSAGIAHLHRAHGG